VADKLSPERRSENMRRIRSAHTRPELLVRSAVHRMGYRFRLHRADLPGKPDMVLPRLGKIIEVRGCFWHQHRGCIDSHIPASNRAYWEAKLTRNALRDRANLRALRRLGWSVLVIWECEVGNSARLEKRLSRFLAGA
jgi:DNA mismatch endonuclease, patch repair protein